MSCIRFNTPAQQRQLDRLRTDPSLGADSVSQFISPAVTDSKIERLRQMATDRRPKIRESVALNAHAPDDVLWGLARDRAVSVRACVARNEATPGDILCHLARDTSPQVRAWVAINFSAPAGVLDLLVDDDNDQVRGLVAWKASLTSVPVIETS